jgi:hypothetical protein
MFSELFVMGENHHPTNSGVTLLLSELLIKGEDHLPTISVVLLLNELLKMGE